jgi:hypothetical protein
MTTLSGHSRRTRHAARQLSIAIAPLGLLLACGAGPSEGAVETTSTRAQALVLPGTVSDTLTEYAAKCDVATGIHVPAFNCESGQLASGQGSVPKGTACDEPNVLKGYCDPGSRFQILPGRTPDAVAVAMCRKRGNFPTGVYQDIAVIQHNKKNGAVCYYQALGTLDGTHVAAPSEGQPAWSWQTPAKTESDGCTGCHDNGGFIRSKYIMQLANMPTAPDFNNYDTPLKFVGNDFASNRTWSIDTARAPGDTGAPCNGCHRLAVSNTNVAGTAGDYASKATAAVQASKIAHTNAHPIWMRPGQVFYSTGAEASAAAFKTCATGFWSGKSAGFSSGTPTPGCTFTPLGVPWTGFSPSQLVLVTTVL